MPAEDGMAMRCVRCGREAPDPGGVCACGEVRRGPSTDRDFLTPRPPARETEGMHPEARYEILSRIGRGGSGVVYKVRDLELDEVIALKALDPMYDDPRARSRFKAELKIARRINHPNVARLYDLVFWNGRLAISQEYIDGECLSAVASRGPLAADGLLPLLRYLSARRSRRRTTSVPSTAT